MANQPLNPHFFRRDENGTVRIRLRLGPEEASIIEEAAGDTPLITYIHRVLMDRAKQHAEKAQRERQERLLNDDQAN